MALYGELILLLLLFLLPLAFGLVLLRRGRKEWLKPHYTLPPGPPALPVIGNLHQLGKNPQRTLWELSKQYGPLMHLQLGSVPTVVISSAQMAEEVLKTHDLSLCSRPSPTAWRRLTYDFKDVVFSPYSSTWRELRKIIVLNFVSTKKIAGFLPLMEEEVDRMMSLISSQASLSKPINLSKLFHSITNDVTCRVAFGKRFYSGQENRVERILQESNALFMDFFMADYVPWVGKWVDVLTGRQARLEKNFAELDGFYQEIIEAHSDPKRPSEVEEDFVDVLLRLQKEDAHLTTDHVKGLILDVTLGGTDTSSSVLDYAMAELMKNPDAMSKAQVEVRGAMGGKGRVEVDDLTRLDYLKCMVKETMRLHPPVPLLFQESMDHTNINGYDILPKTRLISNAWALGREKEFWEKPDEFIPERFVGNMVDFKGHDFHYIPFGAGRRICPGINLGITMVQLLLANVLHSFDWEVPSGMSRESINTDDSTGIVAHMKNGLNLRAVKYNS